MLTFLTENPVAAAIIGCEIGMWVLLGAGLVLRYLLRFRRLSAVTLAGIPMLNLVLVIAAAVDLHRDAAVGAVHVLAAFYLGSTLAFGPALVHWADTWFAHRCDGGPAPRKTPKHGPEHKAQLLTEWYRVVRTVAIASVVLVVLILFFAAPEDQKALWWWIGRAWAIVGLWYVFGPLWESGRGSTAKAQPGAELVTGVADDAELLGDLDGRRATAGVARGH